MTIKLWSDEWNEYDDILSDWFKLVNLSSRELQAFLETPEGHVAGLTRGEARDMGIHSGQESSQWIIKMKKMDPYHEWGPKEWDWAQRQINFIRRMSGMKGPLYDELGKPTRKLLSLLVWGHAPKEVLVKMRGRDTVRPGKR